MRQQIEDDRFRNNFKECLIMKKSIATIFMLGSMVLASTALAQSRVHAYRGTLLNGRIDVPFLPQGAIIPLPIPIQGTFGGVWDIPLLASRSGTIYSTLLYYNVLYIYRYEQFTRLVGMDWKVGTQIATSYQ